MAHQFISIIIIPMIAMCFYRISFIKFLAPLWIVLYVLCTGYSATVYGLVTAICFAAIFILAVYDEFIEGKSNASKTLRDFDNVCLFASDDQDSLDIVISDDDSVAASAVRKSLRPKRSKLTVYEGIFQNCDIAPWRDQPGNDKSFFVLVDGKKVWGIGLADAVKQAGANIGDRIRFWKDTEVRTDKAKVLDDDGKVIGYRTLEKEKRRGIWHMEVIN